MIVEIESYKGNLLFYGKKIRKCELMVLGLKYGHCHAEDMQEKENAYKIGEDFMNRFIAEQGTVVCRELLGYDLTKAEDAEKIKELGLFQTICPKMIRCATAIVEQMMAEL